MNLPNQLIILPHIIPLNPLLEIQIGIPFLKTTILIILGICFLNIIVIGIYIKIRQWKRGKRIIFFYMYRSWLAKSITQNALDPKSQIQIPPKLDKMMLNKFNRMLAINELILCKKYLTGQAMQHVIEIYLALGLRKDTEIRLHSKDWHHQMQGIQEIYIFDQIDKIETLYSLSESTNKYVQSEAIMGIVNLRGFQALDFIMNSQHQITDWDQINILHQLKLFGPIHLTGMPSWLAKENDSVVVFALKLLWEYPDQTFYPNLIKLFEHPNPKIRSLAYKGTSKMNDVDTCKLLVNRFELEEIDNKIEIMEVLDSFSALLDPKFFIHVFQSGEEQIQYLAGKLLIKHFKNGLFMLEQSIQNSNQHQLAIVNHLKKTLCM